MLTRSSLLVTRQHCSSSCSPVQQRGGGRGRRAAAGVAPPRPPRIDGRRFCTRRFLPAQPPPSPPPPPPPPPVATADSRQEACTDLEDLVCSSRKCLMICTRPRAAPQSALDRAAARERSGDGPTHMQAAHTPPRAGATQGRHTHSHQRGGLCAPVRARAWGAASGGDRARFRTGPRGGLHRPTPKSGTTKSGV